MEEDIMQYTIRTHKFDIILDNDCKILILGSLPSLASEKNSFYYGHKQNRFWDIMANLLNENDLKNYSNEEKRNVLLKNHIALYDVIKQCRIKGSSDNNIDKTSIKVLPLDKIINSSHIEKIYLNGKKAYQIFKEYFPQYLSICEVLPSTSPANAQYSLSKLIEEWKCILNKT